VRRGDLACVWQFASGLERHDKVGRKVGPKVKRSPKPGDAGRSRHGKSPSEQHGQIAREGQDMQLQMPMPDLLAAARLTDARKRAGYRSASEFVRKAKIRPVTYMDRVRRLTMISPRNGKSALRWSIERLSLRDRGRRRRYRTVRSARSSCIGLCIGGRTARGDWSIDIGVRRVIGAIAGSP